MSCFGWKKTYEQPEDNLSEALLSRAQQQTTEKSSLERYFFPLIVFCPIGQTCQHSPVSGSLVYSDFSDFKDGNTSLAIVDSNDFVESASSLQMKVQTKIQSNQSPKQHTGYPWSKRSLLLLPPIVFQNHGASSLTSPSPSPFPRYGASMPVTASGELFLFGGLVRDQRRNDLYLISATDLSAALVETSGNIPSPRVGHASALVGSVLIVFGGDTKDDNNAEQDNKLYLLNLVSREWFSDLTVDGPAPIGRQGHAVVMIGSRFCIFGGQVDGQFLDDVWAFDLNSLRTKPMWELLSPVEGSPRPAPRTGHVCVAFGEKIIMFGGTDAQYHYNDTWSFDTNTYMWSELECIGFIPAPREGHTAAIVDDVVYIFGGRGVDGKDLGDLGAFRLSNQRWYMFQNMGPVPTARSGHTMAVIGSRIFVVESINPSESRDSSLIHVLDTEYIRYPVKSYTPSDALQSFAY